MIDDRTRGLSPAGRRAGNGTGDPGRHKERAEKPASTRQRRPRKAHSGVTTAGRDRRAGSGGMASTMKNRQVAPPKATVAAEGNATRKSTRRGANRAKQATQLTGRTQRAMHAPKTTAQRAGVRARRVRG